MKGDVGFPSERCNIPFVSFPRRTHVPKDLIDSEDEDVAAEKERVLSGGARGDLVRIENLTKVLLRIQDVVRCWRIADFEKLN